MILIMLFASINGQVIAQNYITEIKKFAEWSKTEKTFNAPYIPDIRDFVYLKNGKAIFELRQVNEYALFKNMDTILEGLVRDIAFYKDSLDQGTSSVRIDYNLERGKDLRQIRFKKTRQDGDIYINRHGATERLKIEQDTIRILLPSTKMNRYNISYPIQVTFVLNNYSDISKLIGENEVLNHAIDTLASVRTTHEIKRPFKYPTSCIFHPYHFPKENDTFLQKRNLEKYSSAMRFVKFNELLNKENSQFRTFGPVNRKFAAYGNISTGLVRNTLCPGAEAGITNLSYYRRGQQANYEFTSLYLSSLYFFGINSAGAQIVNDNYFINLESGSTEDQDMIGVKVRGVSAGIGYLFMQKGDYFKETTLKLFMGLRLQSGLTLYPEIIATNDFKQIFPGMTLKIFGFKRYY